MLRLWQMTHWLLQLPQATDVSHIGGFCVPVCLSKLHRLLRWNSLFISSGEHLPRYFKAFSYSNRTSMQQIIAACYAVIADLCSFSVTEQKRELWHPGVCFHIKVWEGIKGVTYYRPGDATKEQDWQLMLRHLRQLTSIKIKCLFRQDKTHKCPST